MVMCVAISGVNSDPNPSPGLGIARSLRAAFPNARLSGVDYSVRSSGLHHPVFDRSIVQPVWSEVDLPTYAEQVKEYLSNEFSFWISGLDVEIRWLTEEVAPHPSLLIPNRESRKYFEKPNIEAAHILGMKIPEFIDASSCPTDIHKFGRNSDWSVWVKGRYHEAYRATTFNEVRRKISSMQEHWPLSDIFIQAHVHGAERSYSFVAHNGRLLDAVEVEKRALTSQGKTWAAQVTPLLGSVRGRLEHVIQLTGWTGGGEIEFVRDCRGEDWLIDFNPRFPAYVHGLTVCGYNFPAKLVAAALGDNFVDSSKVYSQFIRTVEEIAVCPNLELPRLLIEDNKRQSIGKHPSFQPELIKKLARLRPANKKSREPNLAAPTAVHSKFKPLAKTPYRERDWQAFTLVMKDLEQTIEGCMPFPKIVPAMSIKTDPHVHSATEFLNRGWAVEAISQGELEWALRLGFDINRIIYNGPVPLESDQKQMLWMVFADSVESFSALATNPKASVTGLRLRSNAGSRFGIDLSDWHQFKKVSDTLEKIPIDSIVGVHMHESSAIIGNKKWIEHFEKMLYCARMLADGTKKSVSVIDIGGGWHFDDFKDILLPSLGKIQSRIKEMLPSVDTIILEPGRALSSETARLVSRIVDIRHGSDECIEEVVVDASIADLPMAQISPHKINHFRNGDSLGLLQGGIQRILGSTCIENDVMATDIQFTSNPKIGDFIIFHSAGAYNNSMSWTFAKGG